MGWWRYDHAYRRGGDCHFGAQYWGDAMRPGDLVIYTPDPAHLGPDETVEQYEGVYVLVSIDEDQAEIEGAREFVCCPAAQLQRLTIAHLYEGRPASTVHAIDGAAAYTLRQGWEEGTTRIEYADGSAVLMCGAFVEVEQ